MRAYLDVEVRHGELFTVVNAPGLAAVERPVTWAGEPGRRLLVAKGAAGGAPDAARLAAAVDAGGASPDELERYGGLLFEAAFGQQAWQHLLDLATAGRRPGQLGPSYLELAIRGGAPRDPADARSAVQALRWEALHDGTQAVAAHGSVISSGGIEVDVSVGVVRLVPSVGARVAGQADELLIGRLPRVLFAVGSPLTDAAVRPAAELMGITADLERDGGATLFGFASRARIFFTEETDHDLRAAFAKAAP